MPNLRRLLPIAVALMLLAGCGSGGGTFPSLTSGDNGAGTGAPTRAPSPGPSPSSADIPPGQEGDTRPSDAYSGTLPPTPTASIVGACTLVTQADILNLTLGSVRVSFPADPQEETGVYPLEGAMSKCRMLEES